MSRECSLRNVVRKHAEASTRDDAECFLLTPAQAALVWWALDMLRTRIAEMSTPSPYDDEYADELRCKADAIDWASKTMPTLATHARKHKVEVFV